MVLIIDLLFNSFQFFRKGNPVFFWYENQREFVLLKPYNDAWLRTIVPKRGNGTDVKLAQADNLFRDFHLTNAEGCIQISGVQGLEFENKLDRLLSLLESERVDKQLEGVGMTISGGMLNG